MNNIDLKNRQGKTIPLPQETINKFSRQLRGALPVKGDPEYETARKVWNGSIEKTCKG